MKFLKYLKQKYSKNKVINGANVHVICLISDYSFHMLSSLFKTIFCLILVLITIELVVMSLVCVISIQIPLTINYKKSNICKF